MTDTHYIYADRYVYAKHRCTSSHRGRLHHSMLQEQQAKTTRRVALGGPLPEHPEVRGASQHRFSFYQLPLVTS